MPGQVSLRACSPLSHARGARGARAAKSEPIRRVGVWGQASDTVHLLVPFNTAHVAKPLALVLQREPARRLGQAGVRHWR